jgi:hypothetical protein
MSFTDFHTLLSSPKLDFVPTLFLELFAGGLSGSFKEPTMTDFFPASSLLDYYHGFSLNLPFTWI